MSHTSQVPHGNVGHRSWAQLADLTVATQTRCAAARGHMQHITRNDRIGTVAQFGQQ